MSADTSISTIRQEYRASLEVRSKFRERLGDPSQSLIHEQLHEVTLRYYDALRPLLKSANATDDLWEERELWPIGPELTKVAKCPDCGAEYSAGDAGKICSQCSDGDTGPVLEGQDVQAIDENGQPKYQYARGLQTLDQLRLGTNEYSETYTDALGTHTRRQVQKQLIDPPKLFQLLDLLDEAMEALDLLEEYDDDLEVDKLEAVA